MPIKPEQGESKDEYIGRCIGIEINNGYPKDQAAAMCIYKAEEHFSATQSAIVDLPPASINFSKISIDFDDTISTKRGQELAKRLIDEGNDVYIISARSSKEGMLKIADELGIPHSKVYATGSNKAKAEKVKELNITRHIDNNPDVVKSLPGTGEKFGKVKRIIFNEDFDLETLLEYKKLGFSIHIKSKRKYQRSDHKTYNKLRSVGLSTDNLVFGELKDLDRRYGYDLMMTGKDPILEALKVRGKDISKLKVIQSIDISSIDAAEQSIELAKSVDMKFATIKVYFTYEKKDEVSGAELLPTSREFCKDMMFANKAYTLDEIKSLPTSHLTDMGLPADVFAYRGGFYTVKGGQRGPDTTPSCRHTFKAKIVVE